jgi:hypothetical protein
MAGKGIPAPHSDRRWPFDSSGSGRHGSGSLTPHRRACPPVYATVHLANSALLLPSKTASRAPLRLTYRY